MPLLSSFFDFILMGLFSWWWQDGHEHLWALFLPTLDFGRKRTFLPYLTPAQEVATATTINSVGCLNYPQARNICCFHWPSLSLWPSWESWGHAPMDHLNKDEEKFFPKWSTLGWPREEEWCWQSYYQCVSVPNAIPLVPGRVDFPSPILT